MNIEMEYIISNIIQKQLIEQHLQELNRTVKYFIKYWQNLKER